MDNSRLTVIARQYTHWRGNPFLRYKRADSRAKTPPGAAFLRGNNSHDSFARILQRALPGLFPLRPPLRLHAAVALHQAVENFEVNPRILNNPLQILHHILVPDPAALLLVFADGRLFIPDGHLE